MTMLVQRKKDFFAARQQFVAGSVRSVRKTCSCLAHGHNLLNVLQADPTRTLGLRKQFAADMTRRFRKLQTDIRTTIIENDAFGLQSPSRLVGLAAASNKVFAFKTDADKVDGFMDWMDDQVDKGILEVTQRQGRKITKRNPWMNTYIDSAYKQGIKRGNLELKKKGVATPNTDNPFYTIDAVFNRPIHADKVASIYTRAFNELKGITAAMDQKISRVLAQALADGKGPKEMARLLTKQVDISKNRAKTLARTETIRAHHVANVNTYREAGVVGVTVKAEWSTAGDSRVCADCAHMEGRVFTLDEIEGLIPLHPNCRCIALPADVGEEKTEGLSQRKRSEGVGDEALDKDDKAVRQGFFEEKTGKKLPNAPAPGRKFKKTTKVKSKKEK